jgi:radical SAM superfamily enzyme YgiQ (UPF0313 family)
MNTLFINPKYPDTFWSFKHALKFVSKKASFPPLGLLTVAAMLPASWNKKLIDLNVDTLRDDDLRWANYVFLGGMSIQKDSARMVIQRCKESNVKIVAGGSLFTAYREEFDDIDHLILNEAELTLPPFLEDLKNGCAHHLYSSNQWADIHTTPVPLWDLIRMRHYASMNIQYSRGCPYDCEFCDITVLYGRIPRTKRKEQIIGELESLYVKGWRGGVFFVDDNFIGNKEKLKKEILPAIIEWMQQRRHPFYFQTEASINLADDEELMQLMAKAGFNAIFVGIESPNEDSLAECKKIPNKNRDLIASVRKIQNFGMQTQGGFIVGFDSDPSTIFDRVTSFIQESGIVTAMVGLLNAPANSRLYKRLLKEGRLLKSMTGDNTDFTMNFIPRMNFTTLLEGYRNILRTIYSPKHYYARVQHFLKNYKPLHSTGTYIRMSDLQALVKSVMLLGIIGKERYHYWKLFFWSLCTRPRLFPLAITFAIYGYHFRKVIESHC